MRKIVPRHVAVRSIARVSSILRSMGLLPDDGTWIEEGRLLACAYPQREKAIASLVAKGASVIVNLHERAHRPLYLQRYDLTEVHLPVADFTPPSPEVLARGVDVIVGAIREGRMVVVHCGAGLGRTGTLLACYLVQQGLDADEAISRVRAVRPGSVETRAQYAAVQAFATRYRDKANPER